MTSFVVDVLNSGRIQVFSGTPPALPGRCAICGTTSGRFVDIGLDIEYYGVVYFCFDNCLVELVNALDWYSPTQWNARTEYINNLLLLTERLQKENAELRSTVDSLSALNSEYATTYKPVDVPIEDIPDKTAAEAAPRDGKRSTKREDRSSKSIDESGSTSIQRDDSLDEFINSI